MSPFLLPERETNPVRGMCFLKQTILEETMYRIEINNREFTVTSKELATIRSKGVKVSFVL